MSTSCPNLNGCPIYTGVLQGKTMTSKAYRQFFCESNFQNCKRFQVKTATGKCPPDLLPNSILSVEQIIADYQLAKPVQ